MSLSLAWNENFYYARKRERDDSFVGLKSCNCDWIIIIKVVVVVVIFVVIFERIFSCSLTVSAGSKLLASLR